jgi:glycosyltransferase involved in cell wall biosynthesis
LKILYISQYFPPEMGAPAARAAELAKYWVQAGHEVTVLTGFPNHPTGKLHPDYKKAFRRLIRRENCDGVRVVRTWLLPLPNRKAHERMLNYGSFCVSASAAGSFVERPDVVIATSPQLLVGLAGWWVADWKRVPFVFEVRDLWPESLVAVGMGGEGSALHWMLEKIAAFLYRKSSHIVVVTPAFKRQLIENWRVPAEKISIIENGVETDMFRQVPANELRRQLGGQGKLLFCYSGTMGMAHGLETLLDAAADLSQSDPHILFVLVGEGAEKERIKALAASRKLDNVRFVDQQPREKIPEYISASDGCLVLLRRTELFKTVIPTKMLEFMACARPVILAVDGQSREIVENAKAGIFVEPENAAALAAAVRKLAADRGLRESLGRNGREHILQHYARQRTAEEYAQLLSGLTSGTASTRE